ncbi:MAG: LysR family transcriptional regulator [Cyanobacteria bacterium J06621_8]
MEWDNLRYVLAIARGKSIAGASRRLNVHHTTVFRRLNALEEGLGVKLFERLSAGYILTPAGDAIYQTAVNIESQIITLESNLSGKKQRLRGNIRIATSASLLNYLLTPCFADFMREYPDIELESLESNQPFNLTQRDADLAIWTTNNPPKHLTGLKIAPAAIAIYGSKNYLTAKEKIQNITEHTWIGLEESLANIMYGNQLNQLLPQVEFQYRVNTLMGISAALLNDLGIGLLYCFMGNSEPDLQKVHPIIPEFAQDLWILTHASTSNVARIKIFVDFIAEALKSQANLIAGKPE